MSAIISVQGLIKTFQVPERKEGLAAAVGSLFSRKYREVRAVDDISFEVPQGQIVGLLGPNGAGKTTTLKCLSGLLHIDAGEVRVIGHQPWKRPPELLRAISLIMGQKRLLNWDLPATDSFELQRAVYGVARADFLHRRDQLLERLRLGNVIDRPVRQLSLGERMKCELLAALLHRPQILFLDEPTIGMDVSSQHSVREFVQEYAQESGATVILTSHYMEDVVALCERILVIAGGKLTFEGSPSQLASKVSALTEVTLCTERPHEDYVRVLEGLDVRVSSQPGIVRLECASTLLSATLVRVLAFDAAVELSVAQMPFDEVMRIYLEGVGLEGVGLESVGLDGVKRVDAQ